MSNRDPKTGRFVKKENPDLISSVLPLPYNYLTEALTHQISLSNAIKNTNISKTKTPTNYWNYILVGVLGVVMLVIGYELHEFLPIP